MQLSKLYRPTWAAPAPASAPHALPPALLQLPPPSAAAGEARWGLLLLSRLGPCKEPDTDECMPGVPWLPCAAAGLSASQHVPAAAGCRCLPLPVLSGPPLWVTRLCSAGDPGLAVWRPWTMGGEGGPMDKAGLAAALAGCRKELRCCCCCCCCVEGRQPSDPFHDDLCDPKERPIVTAVSAFEVQKLSPWDSGAAVYVAMTVHKNIHTRTHTNTHTDRRGEVASRGPRRQGIHTHKDTPHPYSHPHAHARTFTQHTHIHTHTHTNAHTHACTHTHTHTHTHLQPLRLMPSGAAEGAPRPLGCNWPGLLAGLALRECSACSPRAGVAGPGMAAGAGVRAEPENGHEGARACACVRVCA